MDFTLFLYVLFIMGFSQAHRAAFLSAVSGTVGKGLERETLLPFPRLRRFGTHSETGAYLIFTKQNFGTTVPIRCEALFRFIPPNRE